MSSDNDDAGNLYTILSTNMDETREIDYSSLASKINSLKPHRAQTAYDLIIKHAQLNTRGGTNSKFPYSLELRQGGTSVELTALPKKLLHILVAYIERIEEGDKGDEDHDPAQSD